MGYELHGDVFIRMLNCRHTSASLLVLKTTLKKVSEEGPFKNCVSQIFAGN